MDETRTLADRFEAHRAHLRAVALRMLGSAGEAEDAVQEAWLRLGRAEASDLENLGGWLTTVVARVSLDMLRARKTRREQPLTSETDAVTEQPRSGPQPETELALADSVGLALLVVLETLAPAERIAFVLHDMFDVPFEEISPIVGRSPTAARQLASRARRRVQGAPAVTDADRTRRRQVVDAFLAASRAGDFEALLAALDPDVVLHADRAAVEAASARAAHGAPSLAPELRGARAVANAFKGRAQNARRASIDGLPGAAWAPAGTPRSVFAFTLAPGKHGKPGKQEKIVAIDVIMDPTRLRALDVALLDA